MIKVNRINSDVIDHFIFEFAHWVLICSSIRLFISEFFLEICYTLVELLALHYLTLILVTPLIIFYFLALIGFTFLSRYFIFFLSVSVYRLVIPSFLFPFITRVFTLWMRISSISKQLWTLFSFSNIFPSFTPFSCRFSFSELCSFFMFNLNWKFFYFYIFYELDIPFLFIFLFLLLIIIFGYRR